LPYTKRFKDTLYSPSWLREQYLDRQRSAKDIAAELRTDASAVIKRLKCYGIPTRSIKEASRLAPGSQGKGSASPRPRKNQDTLHHYEWLHAHYVERDMNSSEIARLLQCSVPSVIAALKKFGFELKDITSAKKGRPRKVKRALTDPCVVCGDTAREINHIDRNHDNDSASNREPLCEACHKRQHRVEELLALQKLLEQGYPMTQLHSEARQVLLERSHTT